MNFDSGGGGRGERCRSFHTAPSGKCTEKVRRQLGASQPFHRIISQLCYVSIDYGRKGFIFSGLQSSEVSASTPAMEALVHFQEKPEKAEKELHFFIKFYAALQKVTY